MINIDQTFNYERHRYYGKRIGDIVKSSHYKFKPYALAKVVGYNSMDNNSIQIKVIGSSEVREVVAEWVDVLVPVEELMELAQRNNRSIKKEHHIPNPLITEQFLIAKGWVKTESIIFTKGEKRLRFMHEDGWGADSIDKAHLISIDEFNEFIYSGKIPTESQYEVLNQLLNLHQS